MKLPRKLILLATAVLIAGGGTYALSRSGVDVTRAIIESRCSAGAFMHHSTQADAPAADSDTSDEVMAQNVSSPANQQPVKITGDNIIPNSSVDTGTATAPDGWRTNIFGHNNATFTRVPGHNSDYAVSTVITHYTDGDADWYYSNLDVTPGQYYHYRDFYRSDVSTRAVLMLRNAKGQSQYINLPSAGASSSWKEYNVSFFVPLGVHQIQVFHTLAAKGFLETDDFSLTPAEAQGFQEPLITLTFDDGWKSIHDQALPLMQRYGIVSTQYIISGYVGASKNYVSADDVYDLRQAGNEIASHTVDHLDLTRQNAAEVKYQLARSKQDLTKCFGTTTDYAPPFGTYTPDTTSAIQQYYQTARSTDAGFNTADNINPYGLLVQNLTTATTQDELGGWIETARQNHAWLILVYHQIDDSHSSFARRPADFERDLQSIKASGIAVKTLQQAYAEVEPQITH